MSIFLNRHIPTVRAIHKKTTFKNSNINQKVNTVRGKNLNTAKPKAVVNDVKRNNLNAVKASACWVWKPKHKVLDHILAWGSMASVPIASEILPILMACVLLSNLGGSITEVAKDALVAEYGQKNKIDGLQSYAFMALAAVLSLTTKEKSLGLPHALNHHESISSSIQEQFSNLILMS
ncbi:major facilitator superfamily protein [Tanacetum coccineum]